MAAVSKRVGRPVPVSARYARLRRRAATTLSRALQRVRQLAIRLAAAWRMTLRLARQRLHDPLGRQRTQSPPLPEYHQGFDSRVRWEEFLAAHPQLVDASVIDACAAHIGIAGIDFLGHRAAGFRVEPAVGRNYREGLRWRGLNARKRALLHCLFGELGEDDRAVVYAPEALSPMAGFLAGRLPNFIGSEYFTDDTNRARFPHVRHEDLADLSLADASIDRAVIGDVFEHVEDLPQVLRELQRVLTPSGILYSTFPFARNQDAHTVRARRRNSVIEHVLEPEYHGDPLRSGGVLVFQIPGWQILEDCRAAGFENAEMLFLSSCRAGIIANGLAGIMVLRAQKSPGA